MRLMAQFPAILVLGPRQCGKTTLARACVAGSYLDLEKPSDYQLLEGDIELALRRTAPPVILDEAQTLPALFPVLRALIDEDRRKNGRFVLVGSVNPALVRHVSESLAGRVAVLELSPLLYPEIRASVPMPVTDYWLKGGFPDACLPDELSAWARWQEAYVRTFVERDLPRHGLRATPIEMRRFMTMLAHVHGGLLNASELGRALGVNYHTIQHYLDLAEGHYLVRRLPPWSGNLGKRLVKASKVYIRDAGLLHHLLGIAGEPDLLASPKRGFSFEGCLIEQIIVIEQMRGPGASFSFFRTSGGAEIDLVVERASEAVGYEFRSALSVRRADASGLKAGLDAGVIRRGRVVYLGSREFPLAEGIDAVGADALLQSLMRGLL
jgi:predicted AAA+ superfamily ATPase